MNLSKITIPVMSLISIFSLSACAAAGTADIVKKQLLQQLKVLAQHQQGKSLKKTTSGAKEVLLKDSTETFSWFDDTWEKDGCSRYSYDEKGRVIQSSSGVIEDRKIVYQYDSDGKTVRELTLFNSDDDETVADTTFSVIKFYPGYTDAILSFYTGDITVVGVPEIFVLTGIDSVQTIIYNHEADGSNDTSSTAMVQFIKVGNNKIIEKVTVFYKPLTTEPEQYTFSIYISGNNVIDTLKAILDYGTDNFEGEYSMVISKKNPQGKIIEQISITGEDSNFTNPIEDYKDFFFYSASGDIDSIVSQMPDDEQNGWINFEKKVYTYKKVTIGVKMIPKHFRETTPMVIERNRSLQLIIPDGVMVSTAELMDIQGKMIARTTLPNVRGSIMLSTISGNASSVALVRLKSNNGTIICKISTVK